MGLHMKRQISLLAVLLFIFLLFIPVFSCADEGVAEVSSKEEFESALNNNSIHTIIILANIDSGFVFDGSTYGMPAAYQKKVQRELTIKSPEGKRNTLSGYGFVVASSGSKSATLTFENIIIDGNISTPYDFANGTGGDFNQLIHVIGQNATVNFNNGTRVQNFYNKNYGAFLAQERATMNIREGSEFYNIGGGCGVFRIDGVASSNSNAYGSTLNMTGGTITNCYGFRDESWGNYSEGNIVHLKKGSTFNMSGGLIENCGQLNQARGTVYIHPTTGGNTFRMTGGTIRNNNVTQGGVFMVPNANYKNNIIIGGSATIANDNEASLVEGGKSSFYLPANQTITIDDSHLTGDSIIGVYTATAPTDTADVKIATNAVMEDLMHFLSDRPGVAGIIYCDGENDWAYLDGVFKLAQTNHTSHEAGTIWLTTAANESALETIVEKEFNTLLTYHANGAERGNVPSIPTRQGKGTVITVLDNNGELRKNGFVFMGWNTRKDGSGTACQAGDAFTINEDTILYARWIAEKLTVTWLDGDNSVLEKKEFDAGSEIPTTNKTPMKDKDDKYTYTFSEWETRETENGDIINTPKFTATEIPVHTITWMDGDGSIMEEKTWKDGEPVPTTEIIPVRASDSQNAYSFTEWNITTDQDGNLICYPIFQSTPNPTPSPTPVPSPTLLPSPTPTDTPAPASSQTEAAKPVPKTGDTEDLILWGGIMLLGIGGLAFAMSRYHSKRKKR